ncbi:hypothetical protein Fleli_0930 [Bernardetia litoralis DSM 6794]|uniref:Uncharacterized protein n=1 Tax=Bernardetia litoralis (strain ATCC 23117 / DSM 6794 / NBRC 15988 / NCIMB 1366 / Fx l1 / Sio-4) TaxID=880071 RepID=I4AHE9_BERLS|nr:hypothetical protein [Bernardetia litoralis]AFM03384.1 hypothetical protein Fleli_0930 [Bernardetia litoralis DSM 6794]
MKKQIINKSTLLLAFLAVAFWCFYFWKKDRDVEAIAFSQNIIDRVIKYKVYEQDDLFLEETKRSWHTYAMYFDEDKRPEKTFEKTLNKPFLDAYENYLGHLIEAEYKSLYQNTFYTKDYSEFGLTIYLNNWLEDYKSNDKGKRKKKLGLINEKLNQLKQQSPLFKKTNFHKIDWNKSNDLDLWLDIIQHKKEVIALANSLFEENKKKFPTSFESNNFEGYTTLIPDYENQKMIVKSFYFQSDPKYGTEFQKKQAKYRSTPDDAFRLGDSTFYSMQNPRTYHIFDKVGDTTLQFYFLDKKTREYFAQYPPLYDISFKVIPKK